MKPTLWILSVVLVACASARSAFAQEPVLSDRQPWPSATSQASDSAFAEPRRLLGQGKNAEAIAELQRMAAENPGMKGLSHELGVAYYKGGAYLKAIDAFKK